MLEAATAFFTMFFQEILRLIDNYRHRSSALHNNVNHLRNGSSVPGFLRFHMPTQPSDLLHAITNSEGYVRLKFWANAVSKALANTPSINAQRITKYIFPEGTAWAPHSPGPDMVMEIHKTAAIAVFAAIYLPYSFATSLICSLAAVGVRSGLPRQWQFSLYMGLIGWLPTLAFASVYMAGRYSINRRRKESWKHWTDNAERRIREFEGLHGLERAIQERRFFDWVRDGEGDEGWFFEELEAYPRVLRDEESAVTVGVPGDQWWSPMYSWELDDLGSIPSWTSGDDTSDDYSEDVSPGGGIRMDDLVPVVSRQHSITEPDGAMLQLRSMESFDTAALSGDPALSSLPNIDSIAIPVADGSGTI